MKRCPSCNRTYTDDRLMNCGHDGAPLMSVAYNPQGAPFNPAPHGFIPPPPPGSPPPAPWQSYPPPGYSPQSYIPKPGWQQAGMSEYVQCPRCSRPDPEKVTFTWWGGAFGPSMFNHVKCRWCGLTYNGKTGKSNTTNIVIYSVVATVIVLAIFLFIFVVLR